MVTKIIALILGIAVYGAWAIFAFYVGGKNNEKKEES